MPNTLTPKEKQKLLESGDIIRMKKGLSKREYLSRTVPIIERYTRMQKPNGEVEEGITFKDNAIITKIGQTTDKDTAFRLFEEQKRKNPEAIRSLAQRINEETDSPFYFDVRESKTNGSGSKSITTGIISQPERFELIPRQGMEPIRRVYYKGGSYDDLSEEEFEERKNFNLLPTEYKENIYNPVFSDDRLKELRSEIDRSVSKDDRQMTSPFNN